MTIIRTIPFALSLLVASVVNADWRTVAPGVEYREFSPDPPFTYRVARIDLTEPQLKVISSRPSDKGTTISRFADRTDALVAINGDYFDEKLRPVGLTIGPCGEWSERASGVKRRQPKVAFGRGRGAVIDAAAKTPAWADQAVSGWPVLVRECKALTSAELPGSDAFTRSPHPRTAVGFSRDQKTAYFVVVDGKKENSSGVTLARLARFFRETLGACSAVNLDGGGSTAMAVDERLVSRPAYGQERAVANHLAVVRTDSYKGCDVGAPTGSVVASSRTIWQDVEEIVGVAGRARGIQYTTAIVHEPVMIDGSRLAPALLRTSSLNLTRRSDSLRAIGVVATANGQAEEIAGNLAADGFATEIIDLLPGAVPALRHVVFSGSADAAKIAHAFRRATDAAGRRADESSRAPEFSTRALTSILRRNGSLMGGAWVVPLDRTKRREPWRAVVTTYDAMNAVAFSDLGESDFAVGRVVINAASRRAIGAELRARGFATVDIIVPGAKSTALLYFWQRGGAGELARSLRDALALRR